MTLKESAGHSGNSSSVAVDCARLLLLFFLCAPTPVLKGLSLEGVLPPPLDESNEFLPAIFQFCWPLISCLAFVGSSKTAVSVKVLRTGFGFLAASCCSVVIGITSSSPNIDAWMPLASTGFGLLAIGLCARGNLDQLIDLIMLLNFATLPLVFSWRLFQQSDFVRLNPFGLSANGAGTLFAIWFLKSSLARDYGHTSRSALHFFLVSIASFAAIALSQSRTALLLVLPTLFVATRRLSKWTKRGVILFGLLAAVALIFYRSSQGEEHGNNSPPVEISQSLFGELSVVGRTWSLLVGVDALSDTGLFGTQSIQGAIEIIREHGFPTFSHSTVLMLLIIYGILGAVIVGLLVWQIVISSLSLASKIMLILVFSFSGGLLSNPKEIMLITVLIVSLPRRIPNDSNSFFGSEVAL